MTTQKLKSFLKLSVLLFSISLFLINCQQDDIEKQSIQEVTNKSIFKMEVVAKDHFKNNLKIAKHLEKISKNASNLQNKEVYNSEYDFSVETDYAKYIESADGTFHSYTFPIINDEDNVLEHLVLSLQEDGTYSSDIVSFTFLDNGDIEINHAPIDLDTDNYLSRFDFYSTCTTTITYTCTATTTFCTDCNDPENAYTWTECSTYAETSSTSCTITNTDGVDELIYGDCTGCIGEENTTNIIWANGSSTSSGSKSTVVTSPLEPIDKEEQRFNDFVANNLTPELQNWINNFQNRTERRSTKDFLEDDNYTAEAETFASAATAALADGGEVDFVEKRINGIKLDSSLPPCLETIILDLMLGDFPYSETTANTELIDEVFHSLSSGLPINGREFITTYKVGSISGNGGTVMTYNTTTQKYEATVTIGSNLVNNGTKLALIKTVFHESIHAYLKYIARKYPLVFINPNGDFSTLIAAYQVHTDNNYADHVYMANIIEDIAENIGNYVSDQYAYPAPAISGTILAHYEAVSWSGIALISDPTGVAPYIENPVFVTLYPNAADRLNIRKIFDTENGTTSYSGYSPLKNNNCN